MREQKTYWYFVYQTQEIGQKGYSTTSIWMSQSGKTKRFDLADALGFVRERGGVDNVIALNYFQVTKKEYEKGRKRG